MAARHHHLASRVRQGRTTRLSAVICYHLVFLVKRGRTIRIQAALHCHLAFHVTRGRTIRQLAAYPALHALLEHTIHPLAARRLHLVFLVQREHSTLPTAARC